MTPELLQYEEDIEKGQEARRALINKYCFGIKWHPFADDNRQMLATNPWLIRYDPHITGIWSV
jgi:hypothetical protein